MRLKFWHIILTVVVTLWLVREGCNCHSIRQIEKKYSALKDSTSGWGRDSAIRYIDTSSEIIVRDPLPYFVEIPTVIRVLERGKDSVIYRDSVVYVTINDQQLVQDHYTVNLYRDSHDVAFGKLYFDDTVTRNKSVGRGFSLRQSFPSTTTHIYVKEAKVGHVYLSFKNYLGFPDGKPEWRGNSASFVYQQPNGRLQYELGALYDPKQKFPLRDISVLAGVNFLIK